VYNCGLSSKAGSAELYIPHEDGRRKTALASFNKPDQIKEKHTIPLKRLDDIARTMSGEISFIKIDVEGHELEVLRGGVQTLKKHRPNLLIEIEDRHSTVPISETFSLLENLGYNGYFLNSNGEYTPLANFNLVQDQLTPTVGSPEYINNFIFKSI
jgi:hypothetical protein